MPPELYRVLHVAGIILMFMGFGAMFFGARRSGGGLPVMGLALHGAGALIVLVAGFGLHARTGGVWHPWLIGKVAIWVLLGVLPFAVRRKIVPGMLAWVVAAALGITAVALVFYNK